MPPALCSSRHVAWPFDLLLFLRPRSVVAWRALVCRVLFGLFVVAFACWPRGSVLASGFRRPPWFSLVSVISRSGCCCARARWFLVVVACRCAASSGVSGAFSVIVAVPPAPTFCFPGLHALHRQAAQPVSRADLAHKAARGRSLSTLCV